MIRKLLKHFVLSIIFGLLMTACEGFMDYNHPTLLPLTKTVRSPTSTLSPTDTPHFTNTVSPSTTPHPTYTPYFTYTPYPTYTPCPTLPATISFPIPEIPITVFFPENYTLVKNDELNRRGSFLSYAFVRDNTIESNQPPFPPAPYFNEIQFFTEESIAKFVNYCVTVRGEGGETFCNLGNYPDLETYYGQREAFQNLDDYEKYRLEKFGDRYYFTSQYLEWKGSCTKIKEYTTFVGDVKIDVWISLTSYVECEEEQVLQLRSTQSDQLFRSLYIDTD